MSPDHTFVTQSLVIRVILGGRQVGVLSGQSQTILCVVIVRHGDEGMYWYACRQKRRGSALVRLRLDTGKPGQKRRSSALVRL